MSEQLDVAIEAAKAAGEILLRNFDKGVKGKRKSEQELVSSVDIESEKKIISIIRETFPQHSIWSEERAELKTDSDFRWIIDPLDGTHNFLSGIPIFGVSIGLEKKGKMECGVILMPVLNELYTAERSRGTFLNGKPIKVSERNLKDSVIAFCERFSDSLDLMNKKKEIKSKILEARSFGAACFNLSAVASGRLDATIELNEKQGDYAAGWLLIEEAGGKFTTFDGKEMSFSKNKYVASSGKFHKELVEAMEDLA